MCQPHKHTCECQYVSILNLVMILYQSPPAGHVKLNPDMFIPFVDRVGIYYVDWRKRASNVELPPTFLDRLKSEEEEKRDKMR